MLRRVMSQRSVEMLLFSAGARRTFLSCYRSTEPLGVCADGLLGAFSRAPNQAGGGLGPSGEQTGHSPVPNKLNIGHFV